MIVTYTPQGGTAQTWTYKQDELTSAEAELIEDSTGLTIEEFDAELIKGRTKCKRALLWLQMRKDHPSLRFNEVEFRVGDLKTEYDNDEKALLRDAIEKSDLPESQKKAALELLANTEPEAEVNTRAPKKGAGENDG
ncbi:hypothetical protein [Nonomuraea wenchangensis]|uniref:Uncharacterized protein n=1 Tax=Nonomuraea wenchangensis TaxID=568860 RepID=A0A1I0EGA9_9ACTN|nr:hypothetical protein [Nonomuraea wenchangensis]SET43514.1 hypothetical protein SAMN05421811_10314 [Nonomuraea wenchangensis]